MSFSARLEESLSTRTNDVGDALAPSPAGSVQDMVANRIHSAPTVRVNHARIGSSNAVPNLPGPDFHVVLTHKKTLEYLASMIQFDQGLARKIKVCPPLLVNATIRA
jgi:hypothetical protein